MAKIKWLIFLTLLAGISLTAVPQKKKQKNSDYFIKSSDYDGLNPNFSFFT